MLKKRVSAVIIENEKVLLIRRIKPGKEYFVLPGGSVEEGENEFDALKRELLEETGLQISEGRFISEVEDEYDERV